MIWAAEVATAIGIVPLLWIAFLHFRGKARDLAWWWIAGAFAVSWLADNASRWTGHPLVSVTYPVAQAGLIGAVFLFRADAIKFVLVLMAVGVADILLIGVQGPDILLRTVAWLSVVGIVYPIWQLGRLRTSLLVYFGMGWLAWMLYASIATWPDWVFYFRGQPHAISPAWLSWSSYQLTRLAGILLFCWAATSPEPHLKLYKR